MMKDEKEEPIHPTKAFDMIVGTSTGGIISMLLLAGRQTKEGTRQRMNVGDVIKIYKE